MCSTPLEEREVVDRVKHGTDISGRPSINAWSHRVRYRMVCPVESCGWSLPDDEA